MNSFKALNDAMKYIEKNLEGHINYEEMARIALCSKFHFNRMFSLMTDMNLSDYIRYRRLTLAAQRLVVEDVKVIDVALQYGYESPEAFTKAFKKFHGIPPTKAKKDSAELNSFPAMSFQITIQGGYEMDYRVESKEAFKVVGYKRSFSTLNNENFKNIPKFWNEKMNAPIMQVQHERMYGICYDMDYESGQMNYMIAVDDQKIEGTEVLEIPANKYVVFTVIGPCPEALQKAWKQISHEWFPSSSYEHVNAPELEVYFPGDPDAADNKTEIWIPIKEK